MTLKVGDQSSPRIEAHILNQCQARENGHMLNGQDAYMAVRVDVLKMEAHDEFLTVRGSQGETYWVYRRLYLIGNNELDGWRLEGILWIKPDHKMKDLILEAPCRIR